MIDFGRLATEAEAARLALPSPLQGFYLNPELRGAISRLDPDQAAVLEAVLRPGGPNLRVVSSAGTGKTSTITACLGALLSSGVDPGEIIATTYTNKAGKELRERVRKLVGPSLADRLTIKTFHALALDRLRKEQPGRWKMERCVDVTSEVPSAKQIWKAIVLWDKSGIPGTGKESLDIKGAAFETDYAADVLMLRGLGHSPFTDEGRKAARLSELPKLLDAWAAYEESKKALNAWDFADVLEAYRAGLEAGNIPDSPAYVFVDECQDQNKVQLEIAKLLARKPGARLVIVGDVKQSIFSFQAAHPQFFLDAEKDLNAQTLSIRYNYRSGQRIVDIGNHIAKAMGKGWVIGGDALCGRNIESSVEVLEAEDQLQEAYLTAERIKANREAGIAYRDQAVLTRTNAGGALLEGAFMQYQIPYAKLKGTPFWERFDVLGFVAYAILASADSWHAFERILNTPKRYLPRDFAKQVGIKMNEGADLLTALTGVTMSQTGKKRETAQEMLAFLRTLRRTDWTQATYMIAKLLKDALPKKEGAGSRNEDRQAIPDTVAALGRRFASGIELATYADACAKAAAKKQDKDEGGEDRVLISTAHSSKGLQWPVVFVCASAGTFPHAKAATKTEVEEERRLGYVACTRAESQLVVTYSAATVDGEPLGPSDLVNLVQDGLKTS